MSKTMRWRSGKESTYQRTRCKRYRLDPWVGKTPWRRRWQPTPVFLPGESHGQRSLGGYSPRGLKESDLTAFKQHNNSTSQKFYVQFSSVTQSCLTLCDPMDSSTPGLPVHHQLSELAQTHVQLSQSGLHQSLLGDSSSHILMRTSGLQRIIS